MGHNIEYYDYMEKVNRKLVQENLNTYVSHATWQEGGGGIDPIRWNESVICKDYDEAQEWIEKHDRHNYDCLAVRYYDPIRGIKTKKTDELDTKIQEAFKTYNERASAIYPKSRTSEFIGCAKCGSRLAAKYMNRNCCPVCGHDLRPETTLKSIAAAKAKYEKACEAKREYVNTHSKKEIRWMVKIEYHT